MIAECSLDELPAPEIVLVPGGPGEVAARAGGPALDWLRAAHQTSTWTTSVCTGSLILAAAGLLDGKRATGHWLAIEKLRELGADAVAERVVFDGKIVTAAGVSAGIDMALALAARIAGDDVAQAIQLGIEYDPQPPFDAGSPAEGARRDRRAAARQQPLRRRRAGARRRLLSRHRSSTASPRVAHRLLTPPCRLIESAKRQKGTCVWPCW